MTGFNLLVAERLIADRHARLRQEAQMHNLTRMPRRHPLIDIGRLLIRLGTWLESRPDRTRGGAPAPRTS